MRLSNTAWLQRHAHPNATRNKEIAILCEPYGKGVLRAPRYSHHPIKPVAGLVCKAMYDSRCHYCGYDVALVHGHIWMPFLHLIYKSSSNVNATLGI